MFFISVFAYLNKWEYICYVSSDIIEICMWEDTCRIENG